MRGSCSPRRRGRGPRARGRSGRTGRRGRRARRASARFGRRRPRSWPTASSGTDRSIRMRRPRPSISLDEDGRADPRRDRVGRRGAARRQPPGHPVPPTPRRRATRRTPRGTARVARPRRADRLPCRRIVLAGRSRELGGADRHPPADLVGRERHRCSVRRSSRPGSGRSRRVRRRRRPRRRPRRAPPGPDREVGGGVDRRHQRAGRGVTASSISTRRSKPSRATCEAVAGSPFHSAISVPNVWRSMANWASSMLPASVAGELEMAAGGREVAGPDAAGGRSVHVEVDGADARQDVRDVRARAGRRPPGSEPARSASAAAFVSRSHGS